MSLPRTCRTLVSEAGQSLGLTCLRNTPTPALSHGLCPRAQKTASTSNPGTPVQLPPTAGPKVHGLGALGSPSRGREGARLSSGQRPVAAAGTTLRTSFLGRSWMLGSEGSCHHTRAAASESARELVFPWSRTYTDEAQKTSRQGGRFAAGDKHAFAHGFPDTGIFKPLKTEERKCCHSETPGIQGIWMVWDSAPGRAARSILGGRHARSCASWPGVLMYVSLSFFIAAP